MTDKEFRRLSRPELVDIIYQLQLRVEELETEKEKLEAALEDKRFRVHQAVNIADAALEIYNIMRSAQDAAVRYLDEAEAVHAKAEAEYLQIIKKAQEEAALIRMRAEIVNLMALLLRRKQSMELAAD